MSSASHDQLDVAEVRRRVRLRIETLKHEAAQHRVQTDAATASFGSWLERVGVPLFRQVTNVLRAEGLLFRVLTPAGHVRIEAERSADDYLDLVLDTERRPVAIVLRRGYTRGHNVFVDERVVAEGIDYSHVSPNDLLDALVEDATPFLSR
jgi:hypothetical protein